MSAWSWWLGPAGGDKRPQLWPSSAPGWGTLQVLILLCQPLLITPLTGKPLVYTSAWKWDNTFVECEITTMHCGNITQGLRKAGGLFIRNQSVAVLLSSVGVSSPSGFVKKKVITFLAVSLRFYYKAIFHKKKCTRCHIADALHVFFCVCVPDKPSCCRPSH